IKNEAGGRYFCCLGGKNCCSGYKLVKLVDKRLKDVEKFWVEGVFEVLIDKSQPDVVREIS
ncbi:hypothetical protein MKW92_012882, partial [Papaver armeniacum]